MGIITLCSLLMISGLGVYLRCMRKKIRNRKYKIRPINRNRNTHSQFHYYLNMMENMDTEQFFKYTRMSPELFNDLVEMLYPYLAKDPRGEPISVRQRLVITLHYLSEGCSMQQIAWDNHVGLTTVHVIIEETCDVLWKVLCPIVFPEKIDWHGISREFYEKWNMPNCIGALDGKHIQIQNPKHAGTEYFSYKKTFSIVLMAICDASHKFIFIDVGCPGSNHDGNVFRNSILGQKLFNGELDIPESEKLPGSEISLPFFLCADQAFPLHKNIMRPFPGKYLSDSKNIFNLRLSRARNTIECTFGILSQRFRILRQTIIAKEDLVKKIVCATVVLHNFIKMSAEQESTISYCPSGYEDDLDVDGNFINRDWRNDPFRLRGIGRTGTNNSSRVLQRNRELLAEYFVSPAGCIPTQWNRANYGGNPTDFRRDI